MSGARSRRKGAHGEREVANLIRELLGVRMRRRLTQYQTGGHDLEGVGAASVLADHAIEVKRAQRATQGAIDRWWRQACQQAGDERRPVLWFRGDGERWRVRCRLRVSEAVIEPTVSAEDWATLIREGMA